VSYAHHDKKSFLDKEIRDGQFTRLQFLASEYSRQQQTPMLTIKLQ